MCVSFDSLSVFASVIPDNLKSFSKKYPKLAEAAEAIHQGFNSLLYKFVQMDTDDIPKSTAIMMGFGAHSAWILAYTLTASGYIDSGLADTRKAIEFTCYASKVVNSEERALAWMKQRTDEKARELFSRTCSIPLCYATEKYSLLRPLIVAYEYTNYYGAHGNFKTMVRKYHGKEDNSMLFSFMADIEFVPMASSYIVLLGYIMLKVLRNILTPCVKNVDKLDYVMKYIKEKIREARLGMAYEEYKCSIPPHVLKTILTEKNDEVEKMFAELIEREKERREK